MAASTKIKYDVSDVEAGGGGVQPQPALYSGKIVSVTPRTQKANGDPTNDLEVVVSVGEDYSHLWTYITFGESARWKLREFTDAVGLPPKGEIDPKKLKDTPVLVKVSADTDQDGDYRGKVKNLFKPGSLEDESEVVTAGSNGASAGEDLSDWSDDDLKAECTENNIEVGGRWSRDKAIEAILEWRGPGDAAASNGGEPSADAPDIPEELVPDLFDNAEAYESWPDADIKSYVDDLGAAGVDVPIEGRYGKVKAVEALVKLGQAYHGTGGETADAEPEGDATPEDEYDSWSDTDLTDEIAARNEQGAEVKVEGRNSREKMIEALRKDDKPF